MRKTSIGIILVLLAALGATMIVSAQEVTVEPPIDLTVEVTLDPNIEVTLEPTAETTMELTAEATVEANSDVNVQPTAEVTAEMTDTVEAPPSDENGYVRVANFSPDAGSVDIYLNGTVAAQAVTFPSISDWLPVTPGTYTVTASNNGQMASDTLFTPVDVPVSAGTWQTVAVIGSAMDGSLQTSVIPEDYSDLNPGTGGLTFVNALAGSSTVNLTRGDVVFFAQIGYPGPEATITSSSLLVDSGTFDLSATDANDPTLVYAQSSGVDIAENGYTLVALIGTPDNASLYVNTTDRSEVQIARGLLPEPGQLLDAMRANENLTVFADVLTNGDMTDTLSEKQEYTIFAPANFVIDNEVNADMLALSSYIVAGKYTSRELIDAGMLTAVDGTTLTITTHDNGIFVNDVQLIDVNIPATNGVIHMLRGVWGTQQ